MNQHELPSTSESSQVTGLSAFGAVVVLTVAALSGCKTAPTRVAEIHDPFLPAMLAETETSSELNHASHTSQPADFADTSEEEEGQIQLTGY